MTLGRLGASLKFFGLADVLQGGEFVALTAEFERPSVIHYFSSNTGSFERWRDANMNWIEPAETEIAPV